MLLEANDFTPSECVFGPNPDYQENTTICATLIPYGVCFNGEGGPLLDVSIHAKDNFLVGVYSEPPSGCNTYEEGYHAFTRVSARYGVIKDFVCMHSSYPHTSPLCK